VRYFSSQTDCSTNICGLEPRYSYLEAAFGNGKTTAAVAKALQLAQAYPGFNCLMARSTYPKLNDTLRKEFLKWCPKSAIKSFPLSVNSDTTCKFHNGSEFPFRYIAQQGKSEESSTSNLLSATYDCVVVDQLEDPEITFKDFLDLIGRLRGSTVYRGDDPTMPRHGPRWMLLTCNPTRNWVYHQLVKPYHYYKTTGLITDELLCLRDESTNTPKLDADGKPRLLIDIVEGSTYENKHVLPADFISLMESTYRGQMKDRFLKGEWAAYEGLVFPQFDETLHMLTRHQLRRYLDSLLDEGYEIEWAEGYDFGKAAPSCYLASFIDPHGNIIVVDGFYQAELQIEEQWERIRRIRMHWGIPHDNHIDADPDIFRRGKGMKHDETIANLFWSDGGILVRRASNDVIAGITKVSSYLNPRVEWKSPFTLTTPAPSMYFAAELAFVATEMASYFWKKHTVTGARIDEPQGGNDHAMDTIKYMLTRRPEASKLRPVYTKPVPAYMFWQEAPDGDKNERRY
jgi:hypothetical protein